MRAVRTADARRAAAVQSGFEVIRLSAMSSTFKPLRLVTPLLILAACAMCRGDNDGFDDPAPVDPVKLKATVSEKLLEFHKPKIEETSRRKVAEEIIALGPEAAKLFVPELAKDFAARQKAYAGHFEKSAYKAIEPRLKKPDAKTELTQLREKVLKVSRDRNITLEKIQDFADPARKRIEEMLSLKPEEVCKGDATLQPEREALLSTLGWWRDAVAKLAPAAKKSLGATLPPEQATFEQDLKNEEELTATIAGLPDRKDANILRANREPAKKLDPAEARGVFLLNVLRARLGIGALALDLKLTEAARGHSKDMSEFHFFDHESPVPGKELFTERAKAAGTTASGENLYQGGERGEDAIEGWWHSPGHHANMMSAHKRVGLGKYEDYWTQLFGV